MPRSASNLFGIEPLVRVRQRCPELKVAVIDRVSQLARAKARSAGRLPGQQCPGCPDAEGDVP